MRVLVLDDDSVFRTVLSRLLTRVGVDVAATCSTVESAKKRMAGGDIDAVTVDVVLRGESGLDFLKWCRQAHPHVVTALVTAGTEKGARTGVDAVLLGASALLTKPDAKNIDGFEADLRRVFNDGQSHVRGAAPQKTYKLPNPPALRPGPRRELLAIGASTGGPPALLALLKGLPSFFEAPIVVTQHMPALHLQYLAEMMTQQVGRTVEIPTDGVQLRRGRVYLAGNDRHLLVERVQGALVARQSDGPPENFCKPAVDPMFRSIAKVCNGTCLGVVVTGMGSDGAKGSVNLRDSGNPVLVQDEASSVVWGMPGSVVNAGAADAVVSLEKLPASILEWMAWSPGGSTS